MHGPGKTAPVSREAADGHALWPHAQLQRDRILFLQTPSNFYEERLRFPNGRLLILFLTRVCVLDVESWAGSPGQVAT